METKTGVIVTLRKYNGYGFIKPDEAEAGDIYFHANSVLSPEFGCLKRGDRVEFLEKDTVKGRAAYDVVAM